MINLTNLKNRKLLCLEALISFCQFTYQDIDGFVLFFRNDQQTNRAVVRNTASDSSSVLFYGIHSVTDPDIDRVLEHIIPIILKEFAELCCLPLLSFGFYREIKNTRILINLFIGMLYDFLQLRQR